MTQPQFTDWLDKLKTVWETKSPDMIANLCADQFLWHETPFGKPLKTKATLLQEWQNILKQEDISVSYEILFTDKNVGLARWSANFTRLPSKEKVELDGIFQVSLNNQGKCTEFHQWYSLKE